MKYTPNKIWKKAKNPKDEVSSSKTDKMAKDWKIVGKNRKLKYFRKLRDLRYVKVATDKVALILPRMVKFCRNW